jgi:hypothetical protein
MMLVACSMKYGRIGRDGMQAFLQIVNMAPSIPANMRHAQADQDNEVE